MVFGLLFVGAALLLAGVALLFVGVALLLLLELPVGVATGLLLAFELVPVFVVWGPELFDLIALVLGVSVLLAGLECG